MATNKGSSRVRSSRNSPQSAASPLGSEGPIEMSIARQKLNDAIEDERSRLMTAEAVLHCLLIAMNEGAVDNVGGPDYPTLVALARDLVKQSIDRLDSVRLKPMLEKGCMHEGYKVKERAVDYVH